MVSYEHVLITTKGECSIIDVTSKKGDNKPGLGYYIKGSVDFMMIKEHRGWSEYIAFDDCGMLKQLDGNMIASRKFKMDIVGDVVWKREKKQ
tara:strand:- start:7 stop:282 length:276 start_codon:yes stop_codon:yes gene_type:complete